ncbi:MAG: demethoxyubiquinone hydroxylase family protein [Rhodospirillales bacterium]|nr:demethoxyubiquinone hydroxylase family protein [Rhodospirillales bacterium]
MTATARRRLPGDPAPNEDISRMLRVDHAGEYGAVRIYEGQLAILGKGAVAPVIRDMAEQERQHLTAFDNLIARRRVRPTALLPIWHVAGFALGAGSALLGEKAAMACTVAVEEVIDAHYEKQVESLENDEQELRETFARFRAEEIEHRDIGLEHGAEESAFHAPLTAAVKAGTRFAIWLSERF